MPVIHPHGPDRIGVVVDDRILGERRLWDGQCEKQRNSMALATTVSIVVVCVLLVIGAIGFVIDRYAGKLEQEP